MAILTGSIREAESILYALERCETHPNPIIFRILT